MIDSHIWHLCKFYNAAIIYILTSYLEYAKQNTETKPQKSVDVFKTPRNFQTLAAVFIWKHTTRSLKLGTFVRTIRIRV